MLINFSNMCWIPLSSLFARETFFQYLSPTFRINFFIFNLAQLLKKFQANGISVIYSWILLTWNNEM
jgi:hypothetical protein